MTMTQVIAKTHNSLPLPSVSRRLCRHCQASLPKHLDDEFCCHGCRLAHDLITSFQLNRFYEIVQENRESLRPAQAQRGDYSLFDAPEFQKEFVESSGEGQSAHFYMENISCYACVWVCEQITRHMDPNANLSINLASGEATLDYSSDKVALSTFLKKFESLGYAVSPNRDFQQDGRPEIARIAIALFCLSNIMMLAFPEYLGASSLELKFRDLFRWISTGLAALSVFYSGWPFIQGAWSTVRRREVHLDLPIGLALIVCFFYSLAHTISGHPHVYYDSTAAVVALLLIGRWVQGRALRRLAREQARFFEGDSRFVRNLTAAGIEVLVPLHTIRAGDELQILPGEVVPIACQLLSPLAELNYSLLTGESTNQALAEGARIEAGALNGSLPIRVRSEEPGVQSFLLRLQRASQNLYRYKGHYLGLSEKMARGFVYFVLGMAALVLLWNLQYSTEQAITRFATVLLIACPCIFGFGAPLVLSRAMALGLQQGVLFRTQKAMERLTLVQTFFFDKTGTLTEDESFLSEVAWSQDTLQSLNLSQDEVLGVLRQLPALSQHHIVAALDRFAGKGPMGEDSLKAVREVFGQGLSLIWRNYKLRIGRFTFCVETHPAQKKDLEYSYLSINGEEILRFKAEDRLRPEAKPVLKILHEQGKSLYILTGDSQGRAQKVGDQLGLSAAQIAANLSPNQKLEHISTVKATAMVGNGINDSLALAGVEIGMAMANATEALKEKADVTFLNAGLQPLMNAIKISASTRRAMQRCFIFAALFNSIGMSLAVSGLATPVWGAILMPISSLTILTLAQRWK